MKLKEVIIVINSIYFIIFTDDIHGLEFPVEEFFQMKNVSFDITEFKITSLCTIEEFVPYKSCSCLNDCMNFHTCCIDYLWDKNDTTLTLDIYMKRFLNEATKFKQYMCSPLFDNHYETVVSDYIYMISSCPYNQNNAHIDKCVNSLISPVYVTNDTIYKNKHCAKCWGKENHKRIGLTAGCFEKNPNATGNLFEQYTGCTISVSNEDNEMTNEVLNLLIQCSNFYERSCSEKSKTCQLCNSYTAGILVNSKCYQNIHCYTSKNIADFWQENYTSTCYEMSLPNAFSSFELPRYSLTLRFDNGKPNGVEECQYFQERVSGECIYKITCMVGYELKKNKCVLKNSFMSPRNNVNTSTRVEKIQSCLGQQHRYIVIEKNQTRSKRTFQKENIIYEDNFTVIVESFNFNPQAFFDQHGKINYKAVVTSSVFFATELYGIDFTRLFPNANICASPIKQQDYILQNNCSVYFNTTKTLTRRYLILNVTEHNENYGTEETVSIYSCEEFHLDKTCPLKQLNGYKVLTNKDILVENTTYQASQYIPLAQGVGICANLTPMKSRQLSTMQVVNQIEGYLTVIGCCLSIVSYIWLIITYVSIRELRSVPGKNIVALCCMLLLSDVIMLSNMFQNKSMNVCKGLAVILHFSNVSVQCWTVCIAFEIWSTFRGRSLKHNFRSDKRFVKYCLFSYVISLSVIVICIILDQSVLTVYGDTGICWITQFHARLFAIILVVVVCTCFTVVSLTYTIYQIYKQTKKSQQLLKKSGGDTANLAKMSLKLVLLLGTIEVCGFIQIQEASNDTSLILNSIFQVFYTIVRSFRGVFIWIIYIATDRVFGLYKGIMSRRSYRTSTRLTSSSTSTSKRRTENNSLIETSYTNS